MHLCTLLICSPIRPKVRYKGSYQNVPRGYSRLGTSCVSYTVSRVRCITTSLRWLYVGRRCGNELVSPFGRRVDLIALMDSVQPDTAAGIDLNMIKVRAQNLVSV